MCRVLSESSERPIQCAEYFRKVPRDPYSVQSTFGKLRKTYAVCRALSGSSESLIQCVKYFRKVPRDLYSVHSTFGKFREAGDISRKALSNRCKGLKNRFYTFLRPFFREKDLRGRFAWMSRSVGERFRARVCPYSENLYFSVVFHATLYISNRWQKIELSRSTSTKR